MYLRRRRSYSKRFAIKLLIWCVLALIFYCLLMGILYLREISTEMAVSDAVDIVTMNVNSAINDRMRSENMSYDRFVFLEKGENGQVTAIKSNMSEINTLSAEILSDIVGKGDRRVLEVDIPLGNLLGSSLLMGKGPDVPLEIIMLTSSRVDFRNDLISAGINQTKHRIIFEITVEIDVLIPWDMETTVVKSEVLIAETVIVGGVPQTYITME